MPFTLDSDDINATNNRRHLPSKYLERDLHDGLIVVVPNVGRAGRIAYFETAPDAVAELDADMENVLVAVPAAGTVQVRDRQSDAHDADHVDALGWP